MRISAALDPEDRALYGDSLQPPPGYAFDAAVATTFSLDFDTALAVPVSLALSATENRDDLLSNPLALLEGVERIAGRLLIFTDAGHIQAHSKPQSRLCTLLEQMIIGVTAPRGGAFHPKMWALRFKPNTPGHPLLTRLLILSRNLTRDRSWDISLKLDGVLTNRGQSANNPLAKLLEHLGDSASPIISNEARALVTQLAQNIRCSKWEIPQPFESLEFAVNGLGGRPWQPAACSKMAIISPFCDGQTLDLLAGLTSSKPVLLGRSDELAALPLQALTSFSCVSVLDDTATSEDGEDPSDNLEGLHAKAFISERGWDTVVAIGSGNATRPALISGKNVELFAILTGKRAKVGSVDRIMGPDGLGKLTRTYVPDELGTVDSETRAAEVRMDAARSALVHSELLLRCEAVSSDVNGDDRFRLMLMPSAGLSLDGIGELSMWPITRGEDHGKDALSSLRGSKAIDLGAMTLVDITRFVAVRLIDVTGKACALFTLGLPIEGLPEDRHSAILRWIIDSREAFLRYLRLLLADFGGPFDMALVSKAFGSGGNWQVAIDDSPILEEMVRAFCAGGERLDAIERLIRRLEAGQPTGIHHIPAEFRELWEAFRLARADREPTNVD